ncbi:hypothetical protein V1478_003580, partial [Vespula squamosa]
KNKEEGSRNKKWKRLEIKRERTRRVSLIKTRETLVEARRKRSGVGPLNDLSTEWSNEIEIEDDSPVEIREAVRDMWSM